MTQENPKSFSYLDEIQTTLIELDKAVKNIENMAHTTRQTGLLTLLKDPKKSFNQSHSQLKSLLKNLNGQQLKMLIQSPVVRKMATDPDLIRLFAPDTGQTPGTQAQLNSQHSKNKS